MDMRGPLESQPDEPGWWQASDLKWYPPEAVPGPLPAMGDPFGPASNTMLPTPEAGSAQPRMWRTWQVVAAAVLSLVVGLGLGAAINGGDSKHKSGGIAVTPTSRTTKTSAAAAESTTSESPTTEQPTTTTVVRRGSSRTDTLPIGSIATVGDWTVSVVSFQADATAAVRAANTFNDPPAPGEAYSLIRVHAVYEGSDKGNAAFGLSIAFVGSDNRSYAADDCGAVPPDGMLDQPEVFKGGAVEGNVCIKAPLAVTGQAGAISIDASLSFDSKPVWWASS